MSQTSYRMIRYVAEVLVELQNCTLQYHHKTGIHLWEKTCLSSCVPSKNSSQISVMWLHQASHQFTLPLPLCSHFAPPLTVTCWKFGARSLLWAYDFTPLTMANLWWSQFLGSKVPVQYCKQFKYVPAWRTWLCLRHCYFALALNYHFFCQ